MTTSKLFNNACLIRPFTLSLKNEVLGMKKKHCLLKHHLCIFQLTNYIPISKTVALHGPGADAGRENAAISILQISIVVEKP